MNVLVKYQRLASVSYRRVMLALAAMMTLTVILFSSGCVPAQEPILPQVEEVIDVKLPEPRYDSDVSVEQTLLQRRSVRDYTGEPLSLQQVSQLLWAAQGITDLRGLRTAPSAGALYPLEIYLVVGDVENLAGGVYHYQPVGHTLTRVLDGDLRAKLAAAALGQGCVKEGAINIVFTAVYERTTQRYGERGTRYVHMEVGHAAQNVYLQAVALHLGTVVIGAFHDDQVREILSLPQQEQPLYIMPVGRK